MYISSCTGNTKKLAKGLIDELKQENQDVVICENSQEQPVKESDDLVIVCFWCRRSTLDPQSKAVIDSFQGKRILAFGTMGGYPHSDYGQKIQRNVTAYINKENYCLGVYLCQGKVSLSRTEYRRNLPPTSPHHLDEEGVKRHLKSQLHPDREDIEQAIKFMQETLRFENMSHSDISICVDGEPCIQCGMCSFMK